MRRTAVRDDHFYALYYPSIEFADPAWLWTASLIWDRIYRIVPGDYQPEDSDNVRRLTETREIGIPLDPADYASEVAAEFMSKLHQDHWNAAALEGNMDEDYARLHQGKVDVELRNMIIGRGQAAAHDKWLYVPTDFEAHYMTYLASRMATRNDLNLVTDVTAAWTGSAYFSFDGMVQDWPHEELPHVLAAIVVRDFVPANLMELTPEAILSFREKRRSERRIFVQAIRKAAEQFSNCHDAKVARDLYEDTKKSIVASLDEYRKSMDLMKVQGWTGIKTIVFPASTGVMGKLLGLDPSQLAILSGVGLAMGVITGLAGMMQKGKRLTQEHEYSYLVHLQRVWQNAYRGDGDWNYHLCREMEEFIND